MGNQDQNQKQEIKVQKDGTWEPNYCPYFLDDLVEEALKGRDQWAEGSKYRNLFSDQLRKLREVKTLAYEGKVVKVQCHLFLKNHCTSRLNENADKCCHLLSS